MQNRIESDLNYVKKKKKKNKGKMLTAAASM